MTELINRFRELVHRGMKSHTIENTVWLGTSSAVNGAIGAVIAGVLARSLGVAEYGIYTLIISILVMLTEVADLGVSSSIVRFGSQSIAEGNRQKLRTVIAIVTRWKLIVGGAVLFIAIVFLNSIVGYLFNHVDEQITSYFLLSLIGCVFGIAAGLFIPIYQSFKQFRTYAALLFARTFAKLLLVLFVVFVLAQYSITLLVWIEIASVLLFFVLMYTFSPVKDLSLSLTDKTLERQMFSFNKWISMYQAIALLGGRLDLAFVGGLSDAHALGLYGAASKVSGVITFVSSSYMSVLLSEMSSSLSDGTLNRKLRHSFVVVILISVGIFSVILIAEPVVHLLFGSSFVDAVSVLRILCVGVVFTVLAYPLNASFFAMNKSAVFPVMSAVSLLALFSGNFFLVPKFGANGAAVAFAFSGLVSLIFSVVYYLAVRKLLRAK